MEPNYPSYTIEELYSARDNIDRESFPDRYLLILEHIEEKRSRGDMSAQDLLYLKHDTPADPKDRQALIISIGAIAALFFVIRLIMTISEGISDQPIIGVLLILSLVVLFVFAALKSRIAFSILVLTFVFTSFPSFAIDKIIVGDLLNYILGFFMIVGAVATFSWEESESEL